MSTDTLPKLTAVPAKRSTAAALQVRLILVFGLLGLAALGGVFSTVAWMSNKPAAVPAGSYQAQARGPAEEVAKTWLAGKPASIGVEKNVGGHNFADVPNPSATGAAGASKGITYSSLSWDGYTSDALTDGTRFEIHRFLVSIPETKNQVTTEKLYMLSVTMVLRDSASPTLGAVPSLEPYTATDGDYNFDYTPLVQGRSTAIPAAAADRIAQWAQAYATGDNANLALLADRSGSYTGLSGWTSGKIASTVAIPGPVDDSLVVRTRVLLARANGFTTQADYDLLVTDITSTPHIIKWGPAGAGNQDSFKP